MGVIKKIRLNEIINYFDNPRHASGVDEIDTLKKLFNAVGIQYMLNLAKDIKENGLLNNQQIVVVYNDLIKKYVVYDGNRRIAVVKMLVSPSDFYFLDKATLEKINMIRGEVFDLEYINCYVTTEDEAFFIMERTHSGEDKGRGVKAWSSREKELFKSRQTHSKNMSLMISWFVVGDYKRMGNMVGGVETAKPEEVSEKMKELLHHYNQHEAVTINDIIAFHVEFERIHPFQDGNGRVGRLIILKECLKYSIIPFIIEDSKKHYYYRGLSNWRTEQGWLRDTCLDG